MRRCGRNSQIEMCGCKLKLAMCLQYIFRLTKCSFLAIIFCRNRLFLIFYIKIDLCLTCSCNNVILPKGKQVWFLVFQSAYELIKLQNKNLMKTLGYEKLNCDSIYFLAPCVKPRKKNQNWICYWLQTSLCLPFASCRKLDFTSLP